MFTSHTPRQGIPKNLRRTRRLRPRTQRQLYLVPDRRTPRAPYAPAGRTLHLVDLENLVGGSTAVESEVANAAALYRAIAPLNAGDHVLLGTGRALALPAWRAWPHCFLCVGSGIDGADRALLRCVEDSAWIAARFDRVILGSGDRIFAPFIATMRGFGIATGIVAPSDRIAARLARTADFVRYLPLPVGGRSVA